ncbi:MAG: phosphoribosylformylglycinamidine cyclo-ligase [Clostridiales bacterium]|nr:phosphoribosylformylglycinamidine cyclo-ligase [Clostridiales bacterium]
MGQTYKASGVDVEAGYTAVELIKSHARATFRPEVLSDIGGFNALFSIAQAKSMQDPVLVSGTDGVGTKLKIAFIMNRHDTVGQDCVAMCVNDIICCGAEPLFFLDYLALGKNIPSLVESIAKGVADGCLAAGASLIGGETAEMPGFYQPGEYDLAGFVCGIVDNAKRIGTDKASPGDAVIGLKSSGLHSNGFSLVRNLLRLNENSVKEYIQTLGTTLGEELLKPTRIYAKSILALKEKIEIKALCNVTGGGFIENMPRMLKKGLSVRIRRGTWEVLPIFKLIQQAGEISEAEMYNVFNMGIGMAMVISKDEAPIALEELRKLGESASVIGEVGEAEDGRAVELC